MIDSIRDNSETIRAICERYRVKRLEVFGSTSAVTGFDPEKSDIDFLVEFLPLQWGEHADAYFGLLEALERLFQRHVDLVMPRAIKNPYFLESINKNREVLYAA
jgi:uncharacterized protein